MKVIGAGKIVIVLILVNGSISSGQKMKVIIKMTKRRCLRRTTDHKLSSCWVVPAKVLTKHNEE